MPDCHFQPGTFTEKLNKYSLYQKMMSLIWSIAFPDQMHSYFAFKHSITP